MVVSTIRLRSVSAASIGATSATQSSTKPKPGFDVGDWSCAGWASASAYWLMSI